MFYRYSIKGIKITFDKYIGKMESEFIQTFVQGTTEELAKKEFDKMLKDTKHYKNLSLHRQVYIHYVGKEEKIY
jgi:hypothetical protein